jgi:hypothetical protein
MCGRKDIRLTERDTDGSVMESNREAEERQDKICKRDAGRGKKKE